ncbi:hypothetical protein CEXT_727991 [Caerostris extrusa]|uniref:Uncharacterized protein n=1 Tax=Caerostris extrusa TaxID=172846 RepID=A0AAV4SXD8_CAEEX|nr:hypothetical protein CEXT_727991 [Caerostris extrusa]
MNKQKPAFHVRNKVRLFLESRKWGGGSWKEEQHRKSGSQTKGKSGLSQIRAKKRILGCFREFRANASDGCRSLTKHSNGPSSRGVERPCAPMRRGASELRKPTVVHPPPHMRRQVRGRQGLSLHQFGLPNHRLIVINIIIRRSSELIILAALPPLPPRPSSLLFLKKGFPSALESQETRRPRTLPAFCSAGSPCPSSRSQDGLFKTVNVDSLSKKAFGRKDNIRNEKKK